ncbi:Outer membrane porin protein 32 precursor (plasmid) [Mycetohabitans rhizoxinica HKI 454]|uniref:Outer membrane porin protein 32 n=2 Tax=Mycetohabitans rhizoxinica TaxID=412963 RepID=E5AVR4_MYCRK|nr:porin [Mycetohabitans sp. B2]MCG1048223.1 porin [Mycetohabitans sp. B6]CBW77188.1 Outer membrane porin protein 32 precursor [Mycetohabitans rhizoxinica HKI 454]
MLSRAVLTTSTIICTVLATTAHAQRSVTLHGTVDTGLAYIRHSAGQHSQWKMSPGTLSSNEWGLQGTEALGSGLAAHFAVANDFDIGHGQSISSGQLFGAKAFVGLSHERWGAVTFGRQNEPVSDLLQPLTAGSYSGVFVTPGDVDSCGGSATFNHAVKWASPNGSGLTVEAMYAFGGIAGAPGSGQAYSGALMYAGGPLSLGTGFLHIDNGNPARSARGVSSPDSLFNTSVNSAYARARSVGIFRAGGQYVFGLVTVGAAFSLSQYNPDASSGFSKAQKYGNGSVFARWQGLTSLQALVGYNYTRSSGASSATYQQVNVGVDYLLSKRTDVYSMLGYQHACGQNGLGPAQAVIGSYNVEAGANSQLLAIMGVRHRF